MVDDRKPKKPLNPAERKILDALLRADVSLDTRQFDDIEPFLAPPTLTPATWILVDLGAVAVYVRRG